MKAAHSFGTVEETGSIFGKSDGGTATGAVATHAESPTANRRAAADTACIPEISIPLFIVASLSRLPAPEELGCVYVVCNSLDGGPVDLS